MWRFEEFAERARHQAPENSRSIRFAGPRIHKIAIRESAASFCTTDWRLQSKSDKLDPLNLQLSCRKE
jgi:hypothetical protein